MIEFVGLTIPTVIFPDFGPASRGASFMSQVACRCPYRPVLRQEHSLRKRAEAPHCRRASRRRSSLNFAAVERQHEQPEWMRTDYRSDAAHRFPGSDPKRYIASCGDSFSPFSSRLTRVQLEFRGMGSIDDARLRRRHTDCGSDGARGRGVGARQAEGELRGPTWRRQRGRSPPKRH
jgi:hypothetical protein